MQVPMSETELSESVVNMIKEFFTLDDAGNLGIMPSE
jgi:hypothetical protein